MISRYEHPDISQIWDDQHKFALFLKAEVALLQSLEGSLVPEGVSKHFENIEIRPERVYEIEKITKHDIIAFCTMVTEQVNPEVSKYFHYGVTSSDIIDSSLSLQMKESLEKIIPEFETLLTSLEKRAIEMKDVICLGRSHGMYAEPMSFGVKLLGHYAEFKRRLSDLKKFYQNELTVQFSGAVGSYTILTPEIEKKAADLLGLKVEDVSTQVIPRDRIAKLVSIGGQIANAIERISVEIRHLHRSDVGELHEGFSKGQKGSSTMPHKKNPISGENLTGIARVLRSHVTMAFENTVLWHERDISHSSAERLFLPDHFGLLYYAIKRLNSTVENLVFHTEKIEARVLNECSYLSSYYLHQLINQTNLKREDLYPIVQAAAFSAEQSKSPEAFQKGITDELEKAKISGVKLNPLSESELRVIFLGEADKIFQRNLTS